MAQILEHIKAEDVLILSLKVAMSVFIERVDREQRELPHFWAKHCGKAALRAGRDALREEDEEAEGEAAAEAEPLQKEGWVYAEDSAAQTSVTSFELFVDRFNFKSF